MGEGALDVENLSMRKLHLGNLEEGSITGDPGRCVNQGSGDGPISSQLGNLE